MTSIQNIHIGKVRNSVTLTNGLEFYKQVTEFLHLISFSF